MDDGIKKRALIRYVFQFVSYICSCTKTRAKYMCYALEEPINKGSFSFILQIAMDNCDRLSANREKSVCPIFIITNAENIFSIHNNFWFYF